MSTREIAFNIFNKLNEEQLKGFIALFGAFYDTTSDDRKPTEKEIAFQELQNMIRPLSVTDDKKEMEEYRKEKYGI